MNKLKILLVDPRHNTVGAHSNYVPIGIGYIAAYLIKKIENISLDVKLTTDPDEALELIETWKPSVIGLSNYIWNSNLSNLICEEAKKRDSNILCILGGPEFPGGTGARGIKNSLTDKTSDKSFEYLKKRPAVDYFAYSDGEVAFFEIVKEFISNNFSVKNLKDKNNPIKGFASISKCGSELLVGEYIPRIGMEGSVKAWGRDIIPSPYLSGLLDKFLDGTFLPALETARGCPFQCTFCDQGLDQSKITSFSIERLTEEMDYIAKKVAHLNDGSKTAAIFDSNFGLFEKDVDFSRKILETMNKYNWPQWIEAIAPKSNRENILKINDILKNRVNFGLSMQSLNLETLTDIKRRNWTIEQYADFVKEMQKRGKTPTSEVIIPLPGETEETYNSGIKFLMDNNVQPGTYTLMMLSGTELGRDHAIDKYEMKSKWRILSKQLGTYNGKRSFEIEKICVGTKTMSYEDYLNCRNYSFIVKLLAMPTFAPVYKIAKNLDISWYDFSKKLTEKIQNPNYEGKIREVYNDFCKEAEEELFDTKEEAFDFYSKDTNYDKLLKGEIGENLLAKYTAIGILHVNEIFSTIFDILKNDFRAHIKDKYKPVIDSSEIWLKNLYLTNIIFSEDSDIDSYKNQKIELNFDFPNWMKDESQNIEDFNNNTVYEMSYDKDRIKYLKNEIKSIYGAEKGYTNIERAFGRYLMQNVALGTGNFEKNYLKLN